MTFPVFVKASEGRFAATLAGVPAVRVEGPTPSLAVAALKAALAQHIERGELVPLEMDETVSVSSLAGAFSSDPTLSTICEEAYKARDAERNQ